MTYFSCKHHFAFMFKSANFALCDVKFKNRQLKGDIQAFFYKVSEKQ